MIAIALACRPRILVADEPTTALDVTIQAQILELVKRLRRELGMAVIWITHDLGVVAGLVDRVVVMYAGRIVEDAPVDEFYASPQHPYSRGLLASLPSAAVRGQKLVNIEGQPPDMRDRPTSCSFAPRCPHVHDRCHREDPALVAISGTRRLACWWDIDEGGPRVHR
jgi:oligopeptide/dipeptide ABC transporter ATP-binding protein